MTQMIEAISLVWCQTSDMDRSVAFYRDVLGLKLVVESPYWSQFDVGGTLLGLHPVLEGNAPPLAAPPMGWVVGLRTGDLKALRLRLEAANADVDTEYYEVPGATTLKFRDPDGNVFQASQPGVTAADLQ